MVIDKKLNLDTELEYLKDGSLVFANNIVTSSDGLTIQNEPSLVDLIKTIQNFELAGFIACNEEVVIFGKDSSIYRIDKEGNKKEVLCNWKYGGGEVFGTFTYNVNNELIVAVSERNVKGLKVPLKIINLDRDKKIEGVDDNIYTLTPVIPKSNMINVDYVSGSKIKKGTYVFFIKFFVNKDYETGWFPIGVPVFAYDNSKYSDFKNINDTEIQVLNTEKQNDVPKGYATYSVKFDDIYNEDDEYTNDNIKLTLQIFDYSVYTHYQIGFIVNYKGGSEGRLLSKHNIKDTTIIVDNKSKPVSIDELTVGKFNLYNVNTLCNYKNRIYLANYKEENRNDRLARINTKDIKVFYDINEVGGPEITTVDGTHDYTALKNQWKSKPGRGAVYNFFIHYVYPNGNYTDGIPITNILDYEELVRCGYLEYISIGSRPQPDQPLYFTANSKSTTTDIYNFIQESKTKYADSTVYKYHVDTSLETFCNQNPGAIWFDVKDQWNPSTRANNTKARNLVSLKNYRNSRGDVLYLTPEDRRFDATKLYFTGIKMYPEFVGYFISYEKPEYIQIGEGFLIPDDEDLHRLVDGNYKAVKNYKFYYPEFNIVGGSVDVDSLYVSGHHTNVEKNNDPHIINGSKGANGIKLNKNDFSGFSDAPISVDKISIASPNSYDNIGKEGVLELALKDNLTISSLVNTATSYLAYSNNKDIYLNENKYLISLGYIQYASADTHNADREYNYGFAEAIYNYDFYRCYSSIIYFDKNGIIIKETESNPLSSKNKEDFYKYDVNDVNTNKTPHIGMIKYWHESHYPLFLKEINRAPSIVFYNYESIVVDNDHLKLLWGKPYVAKNLVIYPQYVNDLYKLNPSYYDYLNKLLVNYDKDNYANHTDSYNKTVRRSDVIQTESVATSWRNFRPEAYKIISENKGDITNVVGIGTILFVHCEHSLFLFDINNELQTVDKQIQLHQPDSFDVNYKEVFTADKGFGGLQDFVSWGCDEYGYIFYDRDGSKLYRYDNGQLVNITAGIQNLINKYKVDHIYVGNDRNHNRILFNFITPTKYNYLLSFSTIYNTWLSAHNYITEYPFINLKDKVELIYTSSNNLNIKQYSKISFNTYPVGNNNIFNIDAADSSTISVCFNGDNYNKIKVLNFITYILNKEPNDNFEVLELELYTNCCYSGVIDLKSERRAVSEYKKPYYDYERWNLNYFRNVIDKIENADVFDRITNIKNDYPEKVQRGYDNALITGKYVIVRFRFKNSTKKVDIKDIQVYFNN